jgi:hypothetical protein
MLPKLASIERIMCYVPKVVEVIHTPKMSCIIYQVYSPPLGLSCWCYKVLPLILNSLGLLELPHLLQGSSLGSLLPTNNANILPNN